MNYALGRLPAGVMNKTEIRYASELEMQKRVGLILWYEFEGITLKLAKDTRYTPDFFVMLADGTLECKEVKGFWKDDAKVKIRVAAAKFPFKFTAVKAAKTGWEEEEF